MYTTSATWNRLIAAQSHWFETSVAFGSTSAANGYKGNVLFSVSAEYRAFSEEQPTIGGCLSAELKVKMLAPSASIPRMSKVRPYVRVTDGTDYSEWIPQGVFFIDTRETTHNDDGLDVLTINAYDPMLKTEADYPSTTHSWPYSDINVVREIARTIGVGVDSRTVALMTRGYQIGLPAGYSMRETLSNIASMYGGNWICNYDGDLLLVPVNSMPPETNYLIDNVGNAITFGGDRILV